MRRDGYTLDDAAGVAWRLLVVGAAVAVVAFALSRLLVVVIPVVVALFLTAVLQPPVNGLERRGVPRVAGTWLMFVLSLVLLIGIGAVLVPAVASQFDDLGETLTEGREKVEDWLVDGPLDLSRREIDRYTDQAFDQLGERRESLVSGALRGAVLVGEVVAGILLALVITFFLVKDGPALTRFGRRQVRDDQQEVVRALAARAWDVIGGYIRGTAAIGLIEAVSTAIGLWLIGVPLVPVLSLFFFIGAFFPLVGAVVAGAISVLVALVGGGATAALLTFGLVLFVQQVESDLLAPIVLGRAVALHPLVILLALSTGALIGGIAGAFIAVPLVAVAVAVGTELRSRELIGPGAAARSPSAGVVGRGR